MAPVRVPLNGAVECAGPGLGRQLEAAGAEFRPSRCVERGQPYGVDAAIVPAVAVGEGAANVRGDGSSVRDPLHPEGRTVGVLAAGRGQSRFLPAVSPRERVASIVATTATTTSADTIATLESCFRLIIEGTPRRAGRVPEQRRQAG